MIAYRTNPAPAGEAAVDAPGRAPAAEEWTCGCCGEPESRPGLICGRCGRRFWVASSVDALLARWRASQAAQEGDGGWDEAELLALERGLL